MSFKWFPTYTNDPHPIISRNGDNESNEHYQYRCRLYDSFVTRYGINFGAIYSRPHSLRRFLVADRAYNAGRKYDTPQSGSLNAIDHMRAFEIGGSPNHRIVLSQPYGLVPDLLNDFLKDTNAVWYAEPAERSFYSPGRCIPILIMSPETMKYYQRQGVIPKPVAV